MADFKTMDLDEIEAPRDNSPWTPGTHKARAISAALRSNRSGAPMLVVEWQCEDEDGDDAGKIATDFFSLWAVARRTGKAFFPSSAVEYLSAFGKWAAKPADRAKYLAADKQVATMEDIQERIIDMTAVLTTEAEVREGGPVLDDDGIPTGETWPDREQTRITKRAFDTAKKPGVTRSL